MKCDRCGKGIMAGQAVVCEGDDTIHYPACPGTRHDSAFWFFVGLAVLLMFLVSDLKCQELPFVTRHPIISLPIPEYTDMYLEEPLGFAFRYQVKYGNYIVDSRDHLI